MPQFPKQSVPSPVSPLTDPFSRRISYLRLAVTDRCNLRCRYCMPDSRVKFFSAKELLRWDELRLLVRIFVALGVEKIRVTGGEPFVRPGLLPFLEWLRSSFPQVGVYLTTNGTLAADFIPRLKEMGIGGINLSLDTLRPERFRALTGRRLLARVMNTFETALEYGLPLKVNAVIQDGWNTDEIVPLARLAAKNPVEVRFIEEMPFGAMRSFQNPRWRAGRILEVLRHHFPGMQAVKKAKGTTAQLYTVPGFRGRLGIIAGYSRAFCHGCNRLRLTADGKLRTCLYARPEVNLREELRRSVSEEEIAGRIRAAVFRKPADGRGPASVEKTGHSERMAAIGG